MKLGQAIVFALVAGVLMSGPKPAAAATITDAQLTDYINRMSLGTDGPCRPPGLRLYRR